MAEYRHSAHAVFGLEYDMIWRTRYGKKALRGRPSDAELEGVTFAFVCVDKGSARSRIFDLLISKHMPFIDVGMELNRKRGPVNGMVRATYYSAEHAHVARGKRLTDMSDEPNDIYRTDTSPLPSP